MLRSVRVCGFLCAVVAGSLGLVGVAPALAGTPQWTITSVSDPTNFSPGSAENELVVTATNTGAATAEGAGDPITLADTLPAGVTATAVKATEVFAPHGSPSCDPSTLTCTYEGPIYVGDALVMTITVSLPPKPAASLTSSATVSGGGAPEGGSVSEPTPVSSTPASFGIAPGSFTMVSSTTQAGAHPNVTTSFAFNERTLNNPVSNPKDVNVELPPGLIGNPTVAPRCPINEVDQTRPICPADTAVGTADFTLIIQPSGFVDHGATLVYNVTPNPGEPAAFAFDAVLPVRLDASVRSNGNYGVNVSSRSIVEDTSVQLAGTSLTFWGVPADPSHDRARGLIAEQGALVPSGQPAVPFLTSPTNCQSGPLTTNLSIDWWQEPGNFLPGSGEVKSSAPTGCGLLFFEPSLSVHPESLQTGAPTGYGVDLKVPQNESPVGLATPELKNATVSLPAGVTLNPSAANGLEACTAQEIGIGTLAQSTCPNGSQVATVKVITPLLANPLEGHVYLGQPTNQGPSESIPLYLVAQGSGVLVKLAGTTTTNPDNGQLTATFRETPQLPFSDLQMQFEGGPRAPLVNPQTCGEAVTTSDLTPWSTPSTPEASPSFPLNFSFDGDGAPCPASLPFAPSYAAGMTGTARAGAFSPFSVTISRQDGQQTLSQVSVQTPPGLLGMLSQVSLCGEAQANAGTCSATSQIGHTTVAAGVGPDPLYLPAPGQPPNPVYLTGPYRGAPFGLSIVVPAVAGPFNLGNVVVRAAIHIDPRTAQVTVTSDPLPQMLQGIPLQVKTVNVLVDRPGFMFNPTNCDALSAGGTITGAGGASVKVSSPFQAHDCALLPFAPKFTVSTQARTSHAKGASLDFKVGYPKGVQANIREVKVQLPKRLPARLTTLQKACTDTVFEANPAKCSAASDVGTATAKTPVLPVSLTGPAYLVSHGGRAFPDLEIVLQGDGVTIVLDGGTNIKKGITTSTFSTVPDAPISSFELRLPEGPHSALAANGNLCTGSLAMPTVTEGQNGAQIKETLKIKVTGCAASASKATKARIRRK